MRKNTLFLSKSTAQTLLIAEIRSGLHLLEASQSQNLSLITFRFFLEHFLVGHQSPKTTGPFFPSMHTFIKVCILNVKLNLQSYSFVD